MAEAEAEAAAATWGEGGSGGQGEAGEGHHRPPRCRQGGYWQGQGQLLLHRQSEDYFGSGGANAASSSSAGGDRAFGVRTVRNKLPMSELLRCPPSELEEETDYPDRSNRKEKGRLPPAKSTKSSRLLEAQMAPMSREEEEARRVKENFKLNKFRRVESKVKTMMI